MNRLRENLILVDKIKRRLKKKRVSVVEFKTSIKPEKQTYHTKQTR